MFNLDPGKLLIIGVVAILVLGPDKLPHAARQVGGAWQTFNDFRIRMEGEVRNNIPDLPSTTEMARLARSPSAILNHLSEMDSKDGTSGQATDLSAFWKPEAAAAQSPSDDIVTESPRPTTQSNHLEPDVPVRGSAPIEVPVDANLN
jgi:sec-independent protein translocase protein TatB